MNQKHLWQKLRTKKLASSTSTKYLSEFPVVNKIITRISLSLAKRLDPQFFCFYKKINTLYLTVRFSDTDSIHTEMQKEDTNHE